MVEEMGHAGGDVSGPYAASPLAVDRRPANRFYSGPRLTVHGLLLAALLFITSAASATGKLPFIEDDYTKAVARAKAKNLPIFVEAWAPW